MKKKMAILLLGLAVLVAAAFGAGSNASTRQPAGVSAGVAALKQRNPLASTPAIVASWVNREASLTGTDPASARATLRLFRSGLGTTQADLYAFRAHTGSTCFFLQSVLALCPTSPDAGDPGIQWAVSGGVPGSSPPAFVGIVGDNVRSIVLVVDASTHALQIVNNAVYAEIPELETNPDTPVSLHLVYDDSAQGTVYVTP